MLVKHLRPGAGPTVARVPSVISSMAYFHSPALANQIRKTLATERFDPVFVKCAFLAPYVSGAIGAPEQAHDTVDHRPRTQVFEAASLAARTWS